MLAAVILTGGESRRMGSPKALLPYQGRPFLQHLLEVTQHPKIGARRVVLGAHAEAIAESVKLDPAEVVVNAEWEKGQLSSIQAAVRKLPAGTDGMLLFLVDHPLVSEGLVGQLIEKFYTSRTLIVLPTYVGRRGHPVIFSAALYEELLAAPPEVGARAVVWAHANEIVELPTDEEGVILNLNDPEALKKLTGDAD
jgi:molybdenum cofactor cytidylyltransferase